MSRQMAATPPADPLATLTHNPDATVCESTDCQRGDRLVAVDPAGTKHDRRVLCPDHLVDYLGRIGQ